MVRMSDEAARKVKNRFSDLANEFSETRTDVGAQATWLEIGTGQFSAEIADGNATFEIGWSDLFETGRLSAALVAGNTNALHVDLERLDQDYSHDYDLSGNEQVDPHTNPHRRPGPTP